MSIKKNLRVASVVLFMAIAIPASSTLIAPSFSQTSSGSNTENTRAQQLEQRLEEIKNMDRSGMTRLEKKSLRKEVKAIKKEGKGLSGGVYLSVGAIIIIILLLILLL
jgi:predicted PurR-regulated permease PerM